MLAPRGERLLAELRVEKGEDSALGLRERALKNAWRISSNP